MAVTAGQRSAQHFPYKGILSDRIPATERKNAVKASWKSAAAGATLALALSFTPAQAAQSGPAVMESCNWSANEMLTASGTIVKSEAAVHDGPAAKCKVTSHRALDSRVEIYCWYLNDVGHRWYSTTFGWIYSPYIKVDRGTAVRC